jgi:antirestriction protein ArdC
MTKNTATKATRFDIYERVTNSIIAAIEAGAGKFQMPWHNFGRPITQPTNVLSKKSYRGINTVSLWASAYEAGYKSGVWGTYQQWSGIGAQVSKGASGTLAVFFKRDDRGDVTDEKAGDDETKRRSFIARGFTLFNADQVTGWSAPEVPVLHEAERCDLAELFFKNTGAETRHGGNRAFYTPSQDWIQLPAFSDFRDAVSYYATLGHETIHWTGAKSRCDRELGNRFGTEAYAAEELIAELGAAFLCADLGLAIEPRQDHASYCQSWLKCLKADKRALFTAASLAQKAADFLHAKQLENEAQAA